MHGVLRALTDVAAERQNGCRSHELIRDAAADRLRFVVLQPVYEVVARLREREEVVASVPGLVGVKPITP
jgi:hypothetical protein